MSDSDSIGVMIPTRNCASLVPAHLESLRPWIDLASEVVVVDSDSKDGTVDLIRQGLTHPNLRILNHPPGLYQSWNYGIRNVAATYTYISTVGDSITREGITHVRDVAERFGADVIISKPFYVKESGEKLPDEHWPIDDPLERLKIKEPTALTVEQQFVFALTNMWGALIGSSASNLYRTAILQPRPFPTEFGTSGDAGWAIENIFDYKLAITPERFSNFRFHEKAYSAADYRVDSLALKLFRLAQRSYAERRATDPRVESILQKVRWDEFNAAMEISFVEQDVLEACREKKPPWYLQPRAWRARRLRNEANKKIREIKDQVLHKV